MPPENGVSISPRPAHRLTFGASNVVRDQKGAFLLSFITITLAVSALFAQWDEEVQGSATLLVRSVEGERSVLTVSLPWGALSPRDDLDPSSITTMSVRAFSMDDGTVVTLSNAGIVRQKPADTKSTNLLVASPVVPALRTPLSVWGNADRIAWSSPADGSIQVFEKTPRGAYTPFFLNRDVQPNSLQFTEDGNGLVVAKLHQDSTTIYSVSLLTGKVEEVATITGYVSVVPTP